MKRLLFVLFCFSLLILFAAPALSNPLGKVDTVCVHTVTHHNPGNGANDLNFGLCAKTDKGFVVGGYYNSHFRMAYYAGWSSPEWYRMNMSVVGVTGYFAPVTLILIPSVRVYSFDQGPSIYISGSPVKLTENGQSVMHLSAVWKL